MKAFSNWSFTLIIHTNMNASKGRIEYYSDNRPLLLIMLLILPKKVTIHRIYFPNYNSNKYIKLIIQKFFGTFKSKQTLF